jgi:hypothetical protein
MQAGIDISHSIAPLLADINALDGMMSDWLTVIKYREQIV